MISTALKPQAGQVIALSRRIAAFMVATGSMQDPLGADVMLGPIRIGQTIQPHGAAAAGRMHEAALADIDADMADFPAGRVEEHQVAGLQVVACDSRRVDIDDLASAAW